MHVHADHSLFFNRQRPLWRATMACALTVGVLIMNASASSPIASLVGAGVGTLLLVQSHASSHRKIEPIFTWTLALVALVLLVSIAAKGGLSSVFDVASRIFCGLIWALWLGSQLDWSSLRRLLLTIRIPKTIVATLDQAIMHGVMTQREWVSRRNSARLRTGSSKLNLPTWATIIGEGAIGSFTRLEHVRENALIRCANMTPHEQGDPLHLAMVSVERGGRPVLKRINLTVSPGEWILLCGPSGAGKSSLLRLSAGLDGPADGTMTRLGVSISSDSKLSTRLDGRIALLPQNPEHHFIASTVAEDIAWGLLQRGVNEQDAMNAAFKMAKTLGVEHLLDRACHDISFGEQRRVALAGLLVLEPSLLLLDEPTAGLDPVSAHDLKLLVKELVQQSGTACIWATHDLHQTPKWANRVVLLRQGSIIFDGPTTEGLSKKWTITAGLAVEKEVENIC